MPRHRRAAVRILSVTHNYPRFEGDLAGAFLERLTAALARRGHAVEVVTPADAGAGGRSERDGVAVTRVRYAPARLETLAHRGTMTSALKSPAGLAALASLVAAQARALRAAARAGPAADVLHAHWWVPGGLSAWLARAGTPYVVTLHGTDAALLGRSAAARAVARRVLRGAAAVTAVSAFVGRRAAEVAGLEPESILVQPMPLDVAGLARAGPGAGGGGVVTVGRLTAQKRVDLLLEAFAVLARRGRRHRLLIVGDGPERAPLERRATALGVADRVRFEGRVEPARVPETIADADVFVFTGVGEGFGLAAAEALALGIPVVATDAGGGVTEVVPQAGPGRVVPAGNAEALAGAIDELACDPGARPLAAELGARLQRELAPDAVAARFEELFRTVARGGGRA